MMLGDYPPGVTGREPEINGIDEMWFPDDCCWYCKHYHGDVCGKHWNNGDDSYYVPERDDKEEDDCCDDYEWNGELLDNPKKPVKPNRNEFQTDYAYQLAMRMYQTNLMKWIRA